MSLSLVGPTTVYAPSVVYSVQGAAPGATFAWSATGPYPVSVSPTDQQSAVVAFTGSGPYTVNCTIIEPGPVVTVLSLHVDVHQAASIHAPSVVEIERGKSAHFPTSATDQFGGPYPHNVRQETYGPLRLARSRLFVSSGAPLGDHELVLRVGNAKKTITVRVR